MKNTFLKQCPRCATTEDLRLQFYDKEVVVICGKCGEEGPVAKLNKDSARKLWNDLPRDFDKNP